MKKNFKIFALAMAISTTAMAVSGCALFVPQDQEGDEKNPSVRVYMPDGAPALAFAKLMHEDTEDDGISYFVVDAKTIAARVNNADMEKNADICVMPITAASKLLGSGEKYKMLGLATQGNLFLMAK